MTRIGASVLLILVATSTASAQTAGPYRLNRGDTLRYHEVSNSVILVQTPQGDMTVRNKHDAMIALTSAAPGRASAWYEALHLRAEGPNGNQSPDTKAALHLPFSLSFPADGRVRATQVPSFPDSVAAITDLRHEFDDFFVTMPSERPSPGTTWQDTVRSEGAGTTGGTVSMRAIRSYRARGDTVWEGVPALVVELSTEFQMKASGPMQGRPITVTTLLKGEETDVVLFDWTHGHLLSRSKSGKLKGTFRMTGGAQPVEFPESMTYTSSITQDGVRGGGS